MYIFFQIAQFKNPYSGKYNVRKVIISDDGEIVGTFDKQFQKKVLDTFMKKVSNLHYCIYPVYDLGIVDLPFDKIPLLNSKLLLNDEGTEEFHKF